MEGHLLNDSLRYLNMWRRSRPKLWKGIISGLAGGLAATYVMSQFQAVSKKWSKPRYQGSQSHPPSEDKPATVRAVESITRATDRPELAPAEKKVAGQAVHYAFGAANGILYGALSEYKPKARVGRGTAFGAGLWAVADEIAVPALGLSKPPRVQPPSTHLYGLASHLVYGLTADAVARGVRALL